MHSCEAFRSLRCLYNMSNSTKLAQYTYTIGIASQPSEPACGYLHAFPFSAEYSHTKANTTRRPLSMLGILVSRKNTQTELGIPKVTQNGILRVIKEKNAQKVVQSRLHVPSAFVLPASSCFKAPITFLEATPTTKLQCTAISLSLIARVCCCSCCCFLSGKWVPFVSPKTSSGNGCRQKACVFVELCMLLKRKGIRERNSSTLL